MFETILECTKNFTLAIGILILIVAIKKMFEMNFEASDRLMNCIMLPAAFHMSASVWLFLERSIMYKEATGHVIMTRGERWMFLLMEVALLAVFACVVYSAVMFVRFLIFNKERNRKGWKKVSKGLSAVSISSLILLLLSLLNAFFTA